MFVSNVTFQLYVKLVKDPPVFTKHETRCYAKPLHLKICFSFILKDNWKRKHCLL